MELSWYCINIWVLTKSVLLFPFLSKETVCPEKKSGDKCVSSKVPCSRNPIKDWSEIFGKISWLIEAPLEGNNDNSTLFVEIELEFTISSFLEVLLFKVLLF